MPVENAITSLRRRESGEIDPKTMASKKVPGLYFAGEIIVWTPIRAAQSTRIAWATGKAAGKPLTEYLTER